MSTPDTTPQTHPSSTLSSVPSKFAPSPDTRLRYLGEWTRHYNVVNWFTPTSKTTNPIHIGQSITNALDQMPNTAETFRAKNYNIETDADWLMKHWLQLHGVTKFRNPSNSAVRWRNPNYLHYDTRIQPVTDTNDRLEFYSKYIQYGTNTPEWIANHFDITVGRLREIIRETPNDLPPHKKFEISQKITGRNIIMVNAWGYEPADIAHALGMKEKSLSKFTENVADDWLPPAPPREKKWFDADGALPDN